MRQDILDRKDDILRWIEEEQPKCFICSQLKCKQDTLNRYLKMMNIDYSGQQNKKGQKKGNANFYRPAMYYIENDIPIQSYKLKEKLIKDQIKENCCEICGLSVWQEKILPLELHHKNGNHYDNSLDNLMILCPNCHSIQGNNSGANIGNYSK